MTPASSPGPRRTAGGRRVLAGCASGRRARAVRSLSTAAADLGLRHVEMAIGADAVLTAAAAQPPDLVLLDGALLEGNGLTLLDGLRALEGMAGVPVLAVGRFSSTAHRADILAHGATDVIARPASGAEMAARLRVHLENRSLNRSLQEVIRSLQTFHAGADERMKIAREMQLALLPSDATRREIERRCRVSLDHHFESSSELGGDIWGARPLDRNRFAVFLCDFTGHGVAAALNTFRLHALLSRIDLPGDDPSAMLAAVNALLVGLLPESQFATMLYAVVDTAEDRLTYATAGAPRPIMGNADGTIVVGESVGLPLGVSPKAAYRNRSVPFPPGGFLFLFSDALYESRDWEGRPFGQEGVLDLVRWSAREPDGSSVLSGLLDRYFEVMPRPLADDLTAVWITREDR